MHNLQATLTNSDAALLPVLAQFWGVNISNLEPLEAINALHQAMQDAARAEKIWNGLTDKQRGVVQSLVAARGHKMVRTLFEAMNGGFRKPSRAVIEREKPHMQPTSAAEALFYRGLIAEAFEQAQSGLRPIIYIPDELVAVLPVHKTSYADLKVEAPTPPAARQARTLLPYDDDEIEADEIRPADTSIVDDMTTLLAYLRSHGAEIYHDNLAANDMERLMPHLLAQDVERLAFMLGVGYDAELITVQDGRAQAGKTRPQTWLSAPRPQQIRQLTEAWRASTAYQDLYHVEGLYPEPTGWTYNPVIGREAILTFIQRYTPHPAWWSVDEFIELVKAFEPDFQRPGGDYDSWYIRNDEGEYLRGRESWEAIEGALLEFYIHSPMHWLGLVDLTDEAARLTIYGRACLGLAEWPNPTIKPEMVTIAPDGRIAASRKVPTVDRFQLARFTSWQPFNGEAYTYQLDTPGLQQAAAQGITPAHILAFIKRQLDNKPIPPPIITLLDSWQGAAQTNDVTLETLVVLRTTARETLDRLYETPALRRYLRSRLGDTACAVDAAQVDALRAALEQVGIRAELLG